ncbi:MAG: tRNA preQ1(34) S-adenosylmethionine ribosyltransferase-isomerase QueA [Pseudomonadota bacterium]
MRVDDFDFELPQELIALAPARPRDDARLLHVYGSDFGHFWVKDLASLLRSGDLLVLNDTKVIPAQLRGVRTARDDHSVSVQVDLTLHKRIAPDRWEAFARPAKRLREGDILAFEQGLSATVVKRSGAELTLIFNRSGVDFDRTLSEIGAPPLPPYIARKRESDDRDIDDYQTIYAKEAGSVAAPTAGLHFTHDLFNRLEENKIGVETITLHIGAGTFLPVTVDDTSAHKMHSEWGEITSAQAERINQVRSSGGRIVAVGTTAMRLLESAADTEGLVKPFAEETSIFITPGYRFRAVDVLMTNFHLPRSTLFMLVSAFCGLATMKEAYAEAISKSYRFYSFGDACLLEPSRTP